MTQKEAFKELLRLAHDRSICLTAWEDDYHKGGRYRDVEWNQSLLYYQKGQSKKEVVNDVLMRLTWADFPKSLRQKENEKKLTHLLLTAGADPNLEDCGDSLFVTFVKKDRVGPALEIAEHPDFHFPRGNENTVFDTLSYNISSNTMHHPCYNWIKRQQKELPSWAKDEKKELQKRLPEALKYHEIWQKESKDLIYLLFQKGIYPQYDAELFQYLAPVVLERDPEFFEKKKQQVIRQITRAKTPIQIYNAIMGQEKEKS